MPNYAEIDVVRDYLPEDVVINETSRPNITAVNRFLSQITGVADTALAAMGITVPVTDPTLLAALKYYCGREGAYQILAVRGQATTEKIKPFWVTWHDEFLKFLGLDKKDFTLSMADVEDGPDSYTMHAEENPGDPAINPKFTWSKRY